MKKTMRMIVAVLLATVMAFGATSAAFAADEIPEKIKWTNLYGDDYDFYSTSLTLEEGENEISILDINYDLSNVTEEEIRGVSTVCYEFEAEKSGYYLMSSQYDSILSFTDDYNGKTANGCCDYIDYGEEPYYDIAYIEKGTALIGIFYAIDAYIISDIVTIEYLGEKIEKYSVSEEKLDDFIIGLNVWEDNSGEFAMATDCKISFSSEKEITAENIILMGTCSAVAKEGKNKAKVELFGIKKDVEFTAYYIDTLIDSVEITNLDDHTVFYTDYKGERHYSESSGETITVKFNDGTEFSAVLNESIAEIVLPNGATATAYAGLTLNSDGSYDFIISVGNKIFEKYDVAEEDKSFFDNIGTLTDDNFEALSNSADDFFVGIQYLGEDNEFMMTCFRMIFEDFSQVFVNFIAFISYYI